MSTQQSMLMEEYLASCKSSSLSKVQTLARVEPAKFSPAQVEVPPVFVSALLFSLLKAILLRNKITLTCQIIF